MNGFCVKHHMSVLRVQQMATRNQAIIAKLVIENQFIYCLLQEREAKMQRK